MQPKRPSHWRRRVAWIVAAVLAGGWLFSISAVVVWGKRDTARHADAIIVLGAAQYAGRPSPVLRARLEHGADLWKRGLAPRLVLTGGTGHGDTTSEAAVGRRFMIRAGIPDSAVLLEARGRTTRESLAAVAGLLKAEQWNTVILVSDPFHMLRLWVLARQYGLEPLLSPTRNGPIAESWRQRWEYRVAESLKVPLALVSGGWKGH